MSGKLVSKFSLYGFFSFPAAISLLIMQVYIPAYISELSGLSLTIVGIIFLAARLVDTGSDLVVGYLTDLTSARGKSRRLWIMWGTPVFLVVFWALLQGPTSAVSLFMLAASWYIAGTFLIVPYYTLGAEIEQSYTSHNSYAAARVLFGLIGTVTALLIPVLFSSEGTFSDTLNIHYVLIVFSFTVGLLFLSRLPEPRHVASEPLSISETFLVFKKGSLFNKLIFSQLVNGTANALPATLFILFASHVLKRPDYAGPLLLLYFLSAALSIPLWTKLSKHYSKEQCWRTAMIIASIVFLAVLWVDSDTVLLFAIITLITGIMAGADLCLPASMLADLIDFDEYENGHRRPGIYFAIWGVTSKLTLALAIGLAFPLLDVGSALITGENSTTINTTWLITLYALLPALLKLFSVWLLRDYKLSHAEHLNIITALNNPKVQ